MPCNPDGSSTAKSDATLSEDSDAQQAHAGEDFPLTEYLIHQAGDLWEHYVEHAFIVQLRRGTLPQHAFVHFLKQGYLYLLHYARVYAIAAHKAKTFDDIEAANIVIQDCIKEVKVNIELCATYGVTKQELDEGKQNLASIAYSRYLLDVASTGDLLDLQVATAACLIGYGVAGQRLVKGGDGLTDSSDDNPHYKWLHTYSQPGYQGIVRTGKAALEKSASSRVQTSQDRNRLGQIFRQATEFEIAFWNAALAAYSE